MNIQKAIALVTAPVGLIFLLSDPSDLLQVITSTGLNWHAVFLPIAVGIVFGCLAGLLHFDQVQKIQLPALYVTTALFTFGVISSIAIKFEHGYWFLAQPTFWLASVGLALHAFIRTQLRFSEKQHEAAEASSRKTDKKEPKD